MPYYGYRGKAANGAVSVEYNYRLPRILGSIVTGTSDGSLYIPEWAAGRFGMYQLLPADGIQNTPFMAPIITPSSTGLVWSFPWAAAYRTSARIVYGILG